MSGSPDGTDPLVPYGEYSVSTKGSMTLPIEARRAMGIGGQRAKVLMFGQPGRVILTLAPLAEELLAFASGRAAERAAELAAANDSGEDMPESSV